MATGVKRTQVIVAGAGPVGGVAAFRLAEMGIDVILLESGPTCALDLRASTFHPPTLEMMEELGLVTEMIARGLKAPVYQYRNRRTGEHIDFDLSELGDLTPHPYRLQCEQWKLAEMCAGRVADHPHGETLFAHRVVAFEQDAGGVTVWAETPYAIEQLRCDYLIACDGGNSIIRKWLNVEFEGFTYPERFLCLSTDYPIESHLPGLAYVNYVADPQEWQVLLKTPSVWRVLVPVGEGDCDAELKSDAKKKAVFDGLMGDGAAIETDHRTIYKVHQRVAKTWTHGRVMLAGDAAHLNNPLGGLGMNSGIHDVWNLTDKLRAILKDGADGEALLARYERQRRTICTEFVQAQTIRNKKAMEDRSPDAQARHQAELSAIAADPDRRRDYLLTQSMYRSREREEAVA
jgi:3-(3-hydroxy-phenyl)propionate hydroxylase